jgi:hypothetical protein
MKWLITIKKATASAVNVFIVFAGTSPIYYLAGLNTWRVSCIGLFFLYTLLLSRRCLGQRIARTYQNQPTNVAFAAMYTASTATLLWWIWVPLDLALANGLFVQLPCLALRGNTAHGLLAGRKTMTQNEYEFECIALRGQCPDCNQVKLDMTGSIIFCKACHASFYAGDMFVRRVEVDPRLFKTGEVVEFPKQAV